MGTLHSPAKAVPFCNLKNSTKYREQSSEHPNSSSFNQSMATLQSWASTLSHQLSLNNSASSNRSAAIHSSITETTSRDSPTPQMKRIAPREGCYYLAWGLVCYQRNSQMQKHSVDGKNYWTFEYELESPNFARTSFATISIGNGRHYTLVAGGKSKTLAQSSK